MKKILICTVGGSHQPIVTAINEQCPDYVIFVCTDNDPATQRPGSKIQITGQGNCIKANPQDDKPSLPNIPAQTGLTPEQYKLYITLSDDLDQIYSECSKAIDAALNCFPDAKLIADYTGGTKSMSAGLVMAVLDYQNIDLQLVTGSRADLIKVHDGSQYAAAANIEQIRFERLIAPYRQAWTRYAYSEAEAGLAKITAPRNADLRSQYSRFRDLSRAFSEWDNFNHHSALTIVQPYAPSLPEQLKVYLAIAMRLNDQNPAKRDAARLLDLYLNAQRRATQGRYDDAMARVYRLIEWTAQWLLQQQCKIDTANLDIADIPQEMNIEPNRDGRRQVGLFDAWRVVRYKTDGKASSFIKQEENNLLNYLKIRNSSILAHGFNPVKASDWQIIQTWLEQQFIPMLLIETARVGIKELPPQLPACYALSSAANRPVSNPQP